MPMGDDPAAPDRRTFLKLASCGVGAAVGVAVAGPAVSLIIDPAHRQTVTTPRDPIDVGDVRTLGPEWRKVDVIAPEVLDAWTTSHDVVLGAAFVRKTDKLEAVSATCPHLGCPVGWEPANKSFLCPCHNSRFDAAGARVGVGPAKRGLDPLPIAVDGNRLRLTWVVYKLDTGERQPA